MVSPGPIAFHIGNFDVRWYGILIGIGFLLAIMIAYYRAPKHSVNRDFLINTIIAIIPCSVIGARAYYVIFNWDHYGGDFFRMIDIRSGGLAIHGGLIFGIAAALIMCRIKKQKFWNIADLCAPVIALAQGIGRWGNFFNEEAHGMTTDLPWAQMIDGVGYHPTFLYESLWCILLCLFLIWFDDNHRSFSGQIICLYAALYSVERFFVEGLRTDSLMIGSLRQAQVISIVIIAAAIAFYIFLSARRGSSEPAPEAEANTDDNIDLQEKEK